MKTTILVKHRELKEAVKDYVLNKVGANYGYMLDDIDVRFVVNAGMVEAEVDASIEEDPFVDSGNLETISREIEGEN